MDELYQITVTGFAAVFFIVVGKLIFSKYYVKGLSEVFAMV